MIMYWILAKCRSFLIKLCIKIIKSGEIPRHIAFIMDGNRRFAVKHGLSKLEGHVQGFVTQVQTVRWCLDLGVSEVTVFAFSIENFKRSHEEVHGLMSLARQMFHNLLKNSRGMLDRGIEVRVLGRLEMLPPDLQNVIAQTILATRQTHPSIVLNIAIAYTARDEIASAVGEVASGVQQGYLKNCDVCERLIASCLHCGHPDLLIRTSGEVRFSDFLLWQSSFSYIHFTPVLWPEFSIWSLLKAIFMYQRKLSELLKLQDKHIKFLEKFKHLHKSYVHEFLNQVMKTREAKLNEKIVDNKIKL